MHYSPLKKKFFFATLLASVSAFSNLKAEVSLPEGMSPEIINNEMHSQTLTSDFPYFESVNGCGDKRTAGIVPDKYLGLVNFAGACTRHDHCYMHVGMNRGACDDNLFHDMRAACERDLKGLQAALLPGCYADALIYHTGVSAASTLGDAFTDSQEAQKKYEAKVQEFLNDYQFFMKSVNQTYLDFFNRNLTQEESDWARNQFVAHYSLASVQNTILEKVIPPLTVSIFFPFILN